MRRGQAAAALPCGPPPRRCRRHRSVCCLAPCSSPSEPPLCTCHAQDIYDDYKMRRSGLLLALIDGAATCRRRLPHMCCLLVRLAGRSHVPSVCCTLPTLAAALLRCKQMHGSSMTPAIPSVRTCACTATQTATGGALGWRVHASSARAQPACSVCSLAAELLLLEMSAQLRIAVPQLSHERGTWCTELDST